MSDPDAKAATADTAVPTPAQAGWVQIPGLCEPPEVHQVETIQAIGDVAHRTRGLILKLMKQPRTVAEVAEQLEVPVTRLYHHVNRLCDAGLIRVVATRRVGAATERRYQIAGQTFELSPAAIEVAKPAELVQAMSTVFDLAKLGFEQSARAAENLRLGHPDDPTLVALAELDLTGQELTELGEELQAVVERYRSSDPPQPGATGATLFVALFPKHDDP